MFWKKKEHHVEKKVHDLHKAVFHSFSNVRKDTQSIFQWLNYFYQKSLQQDHQLKAQEHTINSLQQELSSMPASKEEIKRVIDEYYSYENIFKRIKEIDERISEISRAHNEKLDDYSKRHEERISEVSKRHEERLNEFSKRHEQTISEFSKGTIQIAPAVHEHDPKTKDIQDMRSRLEKLELKRSSMKDKIMNRITKNSKDYVKSIIISYIKKYERISSLQLKEMIVDEQGLTSKSSFYRIMEDIEEMEEIGIVRKGLEKHYISKMVRKL